MTPIAIAVPVVDIAAAERFYRHVLPVTLLAPGRLAVGEHVVLQLCDPATQTADADKGRTPVLELRVPVVEPWLERAVQSGATRRTARHDQDDAAQPLDYATFLDPFGHLWSLSRDPSSSFAFGSTAGQP
jgi:uncharacterized glyoxalase superfamily protein PhnB